MNCIFLNSILKYFQYFWVLLIGLFYASSYFASLSKFICLGGGIVNKILDLCFIIHFQLKTFFFWEIFSERTDTAHLFLVKHFLYDLFSVSQMFLVSVRSPFCVSLDSKKMFIFNTCRCLLDKSERSSLAPSAWLNHDLGLSTGWIIKKKLCLLVCWLSLTFINAYAERYKNRAYVK